VSLEAAKAPGRGSKKAKSNRQMNVPKNYARKTHFFPQPVKPHWYRDA
jgi:hypothetical protein